MDNSQTTDPLPFHCPECGENTTPGFGLAGGGYGEYVYCECGYFSKRRLREDEE
jgi:hypothetical protein